MCYNNDDAMHLNSISVGTVATCLCFLASEIVRLVPVGINLWTSGLLRFCCCHSLGMFSCLKVASSFNALIKWLQTSFLAW